MFKLIAQTASFGTLMLGALPMLALATAHAEAADGRSLHAAAQRPAYVAAAATTPATIQLASR